MVTGGLSSSLLWVLKINSCISDKDEMLTIVDYSKKLFSHQP